MSKIYNSPTEYELQGKAQVSALVSVFNNVDHGGDKVLPGAFKRSILEWKLSGDPIPVIFSHDWGDPMAHIGVVDKLEETPRGLKADYSLDIDTNPLAAQVHRLMKRRSLKEHSFGYEIRDERRGADGSNELVDLDIIEIGPTLKGMNPETEVLAVKGLRSALDELNGITRTGPDFKDLAGQLRDLGNKLRARDPDLGADEPLQVDDTDYWIHKIQEAMR